CSTLCRASPTSEATSWAVAVCRSTASDARPADSLISAMTPATPWMIATASRVLPCTPSILRAMSSAERPLWLASSLISLAPPRQPFARLARRRRLDGRVQRQQVRLQRDHLDDLGHLVDLAGGVVELPHGVGRLARHLPGAGRALGALARLA